MKINTLLPMLSIITMLSGCQHSDKLNPVAGDSVYIITIETDLEEPAGIRTGNSAYLGQRVTVLADTASIDGKLRCNVQFDDGSTAWILHSNIAHRDYQPAALKARSTFYLEPDKPTTENNDLNAMQFVSVESTKDGWCKIIYDSNAGNLSTGFVPASALTFDKVDTEFAALFARLDLFTDNAIEDEATDRPRIEAARSDITEQLKDKNRFGNSFFYAKTFAEGGPLGPRRQFGKAFSLGSALWEKDSRGVWLAPAHAYMGDPVVILDSTSADINGSGTYGLYEAQLANGKKGFLVVNEVIVGWAPAVMLQEVIAGNDTLTYAAFVATRPHDDSTVEIMSIEESRAKAIVPITAVSTDPLDVEYSILLRDYQYNDSGDAEEGIVREMQDEGKYGTSRIFNAKVKKKL